MSTDRKVSKSDRRDFLKLAGLGTVAGAAAVAGTGDAKAAEAPSGKTSGDYQETKHVKTVYELARF
ncbi:MAG: twin-arginine translocation signal domain-containing protein [Rhodospirillaceae bacterium]|jgi:hypothetical protein|nr:twin-arginine translocation signal domain-containing protein [Rhodospirillaceae bacterium]MBT6135922.1 twin-arginine translocation signal domain-containing protein [Rhodospirillaceae bacterium]